MSGLLGTVEPRRIKAAHRRRRKPAWGQSVQRYYDPMIGRFLSVDPVSADVTTGANFNRYKYASNNPYRFIDPDGRMDKETRKELAADRRSITSRCMGCAAQMATSARGSSGGQGIPVSATEQASLDKGTGAGAVEFYESRQSRGDGYAKLALAVINEASDEQWAQSYGRLANAQLALEMMVSAASQGRQLPNYGDFMTSVNVGLARAHANAVRSDNVGVPGLLSASQIQRYHENYFRSIGMPASTFGGQTVGFNNDSFMDWCRGCDTR